MNPDTEQALTTVAVGGGLLAMLMMRNMSGIGTMLKKGGFGKGARQRGIQNWVQQAPATRAFKRGVKNILIPQSYHTAGIKHSLKFMKDNPGAALKAIIKDKHLLTDTKVGRKYLEDWYKANIKAGNFRGRMPSDEGQWKQFIDNIGLRNILISKGFGQAPSKNFKHLEDVFIQNKGGVSFNRQTPQGRGAYKQAAEIARQKSRNEKRGYHKIMGAHDTKTMNIGGQKQWVYDDLFDVGENANDTIIRGNLNKVIKHQVKKKMRGKSSDLEIEAWDDITGWGRDLGLKNVKDPGSAMLGAPDLHYYGIGRTLSKNLERRASMGLRNLMDYISNPVRVRGVLKKADITPKMRDELLAAEITGVDKVL
jgi:hypothetical protein